MKEGGAEINDVEVRVDGVGRACVLSTANIKKDEMVLFVPDCLSVDIEKVK